MNKKIIIFLTSVLIFFIVFLVYLYIFDNNTNNLGDKYEEANNNRKIEKISSYNNPVVPEGFKKVETDSASWELENGIPKGWNDGLVIEDEQGNQFVWVPVNLENSNVKARDLKYNYAYDKDNMKHSEKEELQIIKYEGFYIARYEAGISNEISNGISEFNSITNNVEGIPISKKGQIVWNYIDWTNAKKNSSKMYQNEFVESDLITTKQWFHTMRWLEEKGYDIENSIEWGNYSNNNFEFTGYYSTDYGKTYNYGKNIMKQKYNMILSTGATERNKSNNIYDLAGNVSEFVDVRKYINGYYGEEEEYCNYGGYYDNISHYSAASSMSLSSANSRQGFRVVLYIK